MPWPDEIVLSVRAAALTQLARVLAAGKHDAAGKPPFVPGTDGVGEVEGRRMYSRSRARLSGAWVSSPPSRGTPRCRSPTTSTRHGRGRRERGHDVVGRAHAAGALRAR